MPNLSAMSIARAGCRRPVPITRRRLASVSTAPAYRLREGELGGSIGERRHDLTRGDHGTGREDDEGLNAGIGADASVRRLNRRHLRGLADEDVAQDGVRSDARPALDDAVRSEERRVGKE